jgi:hypothetical protein
VTQPATFAAMSLQAMAEHADVLHRLALAVDCRDTVTHHRVATEVRIGREVPQEVLPLGHDRAWPCWNLIVKDAGRAVVMLDLRAPTTVRLRIADPRRRYVARRFDLPLWTLREVLDQESAGSPVPAASRLLGPWLLPGSAAALSRGTTAIRGRVVRGTDPVRWPRITARGPGQQAVGWAHGDERGEFVLVIEDTGTLPPPAPTQLPIQLFVTARIPSTPDPFDPYADLTIEPIPRSAAPPGPDDLDNNVLRGRKTPTDHVSSTTVPPPISVPVGQEFLLASPVPFTM